MYGDYVRCFSNGKLNVQYMELPMLSWQLSAVYNNSEYLKSLGKLNISMVIVVKVRSLVLIMS